MDKRGHYNPIHDENLVYNRLGYNTDESNCPVNEPRASTQQPPWETESTRTIYEKLEAKVTKSHNNGISNLKLITLINIVDRLESIEDKLDRLLRSQ